MAVLYVRPDTIEKDLTEAANDVTGSFRQSYDELIRDVVIPARRRNRSATASVPAAASVSAAPDKAVTLGVAAAAVTPEARGNSVAYPVNVTVRLKYAFPDPDAALSYGNGICDEFNHEGTYALIMRDIETDSVSRRVRSLVLVDTGGKTCHTQS